MQKLEFIELLCYQTNVDENGVSSFENLLDQLAHQRFALIHSALPLPQILALKERAESGLAERRFRAARIGQTRENDPQIRSDSIFWIEDSTSDPAERALLLYFSSLMSALNQSLFLGLKTVEAHYASYEPGQFYRRHLDRFQTDDARTISLVLYLNDDWATDDQGQLRAYIEGREVDVLPTSGTLVCFDSAAIEHEVLPSRNRRRLSIAAWFRR